MLEFYPIIWDLVDYCHDSQRHHNDHNHKWNDSQMFVHYQADHGTLSDFTNIGFQVEKIHILSN